ncbi:acyltransferase family protein [Chitiniphilus shinanonensis]|uniref:acyltransferase family protein n=1 Tax=Chitiniphilus shinanonensis TaxID=553088 RepID=UPI0003A67517|nr:acyltransferase family protein [Chitiniphilus shinanonensis]
MNNSEIAAVQVARLRQATYRPDIDGLRALAVIAVILFHLSPTWLPGGFVGVDIFFVISGFVVTASLAKMGPLPLGQFFGEFYARRMARILPALTLVLVVSVIVATLFIPSAWLSELSNDTARYAFWGLSNWVMQSNTDTYFAPRAEFNPYTHTWSLGIEEQFYLLVPILVFLWVRLTHSGRGLRAFAVATLISLLVLASALGAAWATENWPTVAFYFIGFRFWELGLGVIAFMLTQRFHISTSSHRIRHNATACAGLTLVATGLIYADPHRFPFPWAWVPALGTLLLIGGAHIQPLDPVRRLFASRAPVWIGKRSYSLYLWHWPVFVLMRWTVGLETTLQQCIAIGITATLAFSSYRLVETPLRHHRWLEQRSPVARILLFSLMPLLGFWIASHVFEHQGRYSFSQVTRNSSEWYVPSGKLPFVNPETRQCETDSTREPLANGWTLRFSAKGCATSSSTQKIYVLGDSHATHLTGLIELVTATLGIDSVIYFSPPSCPFLNMRNPMAGARADCLGYYKAATEAIVTSAKPGDVVLLSSFRLDRWANQWGDLGIKDMRAHLFGAYTDTQRNSVIADARTWIMPFVKKDLNVVLVAPTPVFRAPAFRCSDWFNKGNPACSGGLTQERKELELLRAPIIETMRRISNFDAHISIWDPFPVLCPKSTCSAKINDKPLFFDGDHLSAYGNYILHPSLTAYLEKIGSGAVGINIESMYSYPIKVDSDMTNASQILIKGWYPVEPSHAWSTQEAALRLPVPEQCHANTCSAILRFAVFGASSQRNVTVKLNGRTEEKAWQKSITATSDQLQEVEVPLDPKTSSSVVQLSIPTAASPEQLTLSGDTRVLGVALKEIQLREESTTPLRVQ